VGVLFGLGLMARSEKPATEYWRCRNCAPVTALTHERVGAGETVLQLLAGRLTTPRITEDKTLYSRRPVGES